MLTEEQLALRDQVYEGGLAGATAESVVSQTESFTAQQKSRWQMLKQTQSQIRLEATTHLARLIGARKLRNSEADFVEVDSVSELIQHAFPNTPEVDTPAGYAQTFARFSDIDIGSRRRFLQLFRKSMEQPIDTAQRAGF